VRATDNEVVANDAVGNINESFSRNIRRGLARVAKRHSPVTVHDKVLLHDHLAGANPDEDGGPPAALAAFDVPKHVVAKGPVFQSHHVDSRDVVASKQPVSGRYLRVFKVASANRSFHCAGASILRGGAFNRTHTYVPKPAVENMDVPGRAF